MMYGQHGTIPGYTQPAPNVQNITSNQVPSALVQSFMYIGPARKVYLLSLVCMPAWGDITAIKFWGKNSVAEVSLPACSIPTNIVLGASGAGVSLPMVPGWTYVTGSADGVVIIMDGPDANTAHTIWALVYTGQYRLN